MRPSAETTHRAACDCTFRNQVLAELRVRACPNLFKSQIRAQRASISGQRLRRLLRPQISTAAAATGLEGNETTSEGALSSACLQLSPHTYLLMVNRARTAGMSLCFAGPTSIELQGQSYHLIDLVRRCKVLFTMRILLRPCIWSICLMRLVRDPHLPCAGGL